MGDDDFTDGLDSLFDELAIEEEQNAKADAVMEIVEEDKSPVLPKGKDKEVVWETEKDNSTCKKCVAKRGTKVPKKGKRYHHIRCRCYPTVTTKKFEGLSIPLLERQLKVMSKLKDSDWKTAQTKRVTTRIAELKAKDRATTTTMKEKSA